MVSGLPVKNYRAEVTLTPTSGGGTTIRWAASWDKTLMGGLVRRKLAQIYPEMVAAADQQVAPSARP